MVSVVQPLNRTASRKMEDRFLLGAYVNEVSRALLEVKFQEQNSSRGIRKLDLSDLFRG